VTWSKDFTQVLDWSNAPFAKWFVGRRAQRGLQLRRPARRGRPRRPGRHALRGRARRHPRRSRMPTCSARCPRPPTRWSRLGVGKGDTVAIYLPMIPEAAVAMLACARIGAPHSVVFGGFSAEALNTRIATPRPRSSSPPTAATAAAPPAPSSPPSTPPSTTPTRPCEKVLVVKRTGQDTSVERRPRPVVARRDGAASDDHEAQGHGQPSTRCSSSTPPARPGSPRASSTPPAATSPRRLHQRGRARRAPRDRRLLVHRRHRLGHRPLLHRLRPAGQWRDPGAVRGHPGHPAPGPVVGDHPEVQGDDPLHRADGDPHLHEVGRDIPAKFDLSSMRVLGSVGEPINPEAWMWYRKYIGGDRCPIVDTWWQTETGAIMISPLPGVTTLKPGSAQKPIPGIGPRSSTTMGTRSPRGEGRLPRAHQAVAGDAARHLGRPGALPRHLLEPLRPRSTTSPATAPRRTRTATSGCSAGSTTS
jgi:acetyl-CoA synthetase